MWCNAELKVYITLFEKWIQILDHVFLIPQLLSRSATHEAIGLLGFYVRYQALYTIILLVKYSEILCPMIIVKSF